MNPFHHRFTSRVLRLAFLWTMGNSPRVPNPSENERILLGELLRQVSRTFYRTLRALPASVRTQISLAYLLARTTDTIADTEIIPPSERLAALQRLRARILGRSSVPLDFGELARQQGSPAERVLLDRIEDSLNLLDQLATPDLELVRGVLDTITGGQELDLQRFSQASRSSILALQSEAELEDYTFRVAGCVGEFWTRICRAHVFPHARMDEARLVAEGIRFGKGLQLVNILRDLPGDLRKGRCYLPETELAEVGLRPADLLESGREATLRPLYDRYLASAASHLAVGWTYTNSLPWRNARVRLACAWPVLIGVRTLARLRTENPLDPARPIKISRAEVRGILWRSVLLYPIPPLWRLQAPLAA